MFDASASTDRLIELILHEDKDVLKELLTTDKVVATKTDNVYFGRQPNKEEHAAFSLAQKKSREALKEKTVTLRKLEKELAALTKLAEDNLRERVKKRPEIAVLKRAVANAKKKRGGGNEEVAKPQSSQCDVRRSIRAKIIRSGESSQFCKRLNETRAFSGDGTGRATPRHFDASQLARFAFRCNG